MPGAGPLGDLDRAVDAARDEMAGLGWGDPAELGAAGDPRFLRWYWRLRLQWLEARRAAENSVSPIEVANTLLGLGRRDAAVRQAQDAVRRGVGWQHLYLPHHPWWDPVRHDPRFRRLMTELVSGWTETRHALPAGRG